MKIVFLFVCHVTGLEASANRVRAPAGLTVRVPLPDARASKGSVQRTRLLVAQQGYSQQGHAQLPSGWAAGFDEATGAPYYYHEQTSQCQWEPPQAAPTLQGSCAPVLWRLHGCPGITGFIDLGSHFQRDEYALPYTMRHGDEQVLSRFHMIDQKLTVSRKQATVRVDAVGTAILCSYGRGPTLWRCNGGPWVALHAEDSLALTDGDQVSLDCNHPDAAVFTCLAETGMEAPIKQGGYPGLLYPWEQLVDENGAAYYFNPHTGESSWDAIGKGYMG